VSTPYRIDGEELLLRVKVLPHAGRNQIAGVRGEELAVRVQAPAQKGEANKELIRFLAKTLDVPRGSIQIAAGQTSGHKLLRLPAAGRMRLEPFLREEGR